MLSTVLHLLKDSSKNERGVQWKWWDQHDRMAHWYQALTWRDVRIRKPALKAHLFTQTAQSSPTRVERLFVLWIHCIDWEGYECMMSEMELRRMYDSWSVWGGYVLSFNVSEQCLPSSGHT